MDMEYFDLWYFLSDCWNRSYAVYKVTKDQRYLEHCKTIVVCEDIVRSYQFPDNAETGI